MPITTVFAEIDAEIARLEQARFLISGESPKVGVKVPIADYRKFRKGDSKDDHEHNLDQYYASQGMTTVLSNASRDFRNSDLERC
jgi:hypothetical protein